MKKMVQLRPRNLRCNNVREAQACPTKGRGGAEQNLLEKATPMSWGMNSTITDQEGPDVENPTCSAGHRPDQIVGR